MQELLCLFKSAAGIQQVVFFIGYEDYTGEYKLNYFGDWFPDLDFTSNVMDYIIPDSDRFFSFIATLSTHGPYDSQTSDLNEYYQLFEQNYDEFVVWFTENTDYILPSNEYDLTLFKNYKAAIIDLDKTVENLIQELEMRGRADDTSILLFADHNSYYSDLCYKIKGIEKSNSSNTYINNIPMIFYSPKYVNGESYFVSAVLEDTTTGRQIGYSHSIGELAMGEEKEVLRASFDVPETVTDSYKVKFYIWDSTKDRNSMWETIIKP